MIIIRDARDDDGDALLLVLGAAFSEYPTCLMERSEYPELARPASSFAAQRGVLWVVEDHLGVVGCGGVAPSTSAELFEVKKVYLLPRARGRSIGGRLVAMAERFALAAGGERMHLFTDTRFTTAHRVYEHAGYARLPDVRALGDVSQSLEYHYEKRLAGAPA